MRPVEYSHYLGKKPEGDRFNVWFRTTGSLPDDPAIHRCALAYASDLTLLDSSLVPLGRTLFEPAFMGASLDHALWLHRPFRADEWLLYSQDSPNLHGSRGLVARIDLPAGRHPGGLGDAGRPGPRCGAEDYFLHIPARLALVLTASGRNRRPQSAREASKS